MESRTQGRRYCFTIFGDVQGSTLFDTVKVHTDVRGIVLQKERCETTGREHLQGYIEFTRPKRLMAVKRMLGETAHLELAKGNRLSNVEYCTKSESRIEGPWITESLTNEKRKRCSDLAVIAHEIFEGDSTFADICATRPELVLRYTKGILALLSSRDLAARQHPRVDLRVEVYYGRAGVGKTRLALSRAYGHEEEQTELGPADVYILSSPNSGTLWFDGYQGERYLLLDDFYGWINHDVLLRVLDIYRLQLAVKGSYTYANWNVIRLTSNKHPSTWYRNWPWEEDEALKRRIHAIYRCERDIFGNLILFDEMTETSINFNFN